MTKAAGIRARNRAAIEAEIMSAAKAHLAEQGAAGISLRAIARELGMTSSAIYRYVESRDELLTRLIVRAYTDSADRAEEAVSALGAGHDSVERFRTVARALRGWALGSPHEYALIYGSPVPGYHAPGERTIEVGTRIQRLLLEVEDPDRPAASTQETEVFAPVAREVGWASDEFAVAQLRRGMSAWTLVIGAISAEVFEHFGPDPFEDPSAHFEIVLDDAELILRRRADG